MCAAMRHRGPDDGGCESHGSATVGMCRLAIYDPANGHQPMRTPDGRYVLIFNGSIVNHRMLRDELAGHWTFRTHCDTEVLLAAFVHWGEDCIKRLRGMFAFAVWDTREGTLRLARDPFGIKPLYYRHDGRRLVFASELNALLAGGMPAEIDPHAVADYLAWFCVPAPRTIYRGAFSLHPGEIATFREAQLDLRRAWTFRTIPAGSGPCSSRGEFRRELRSRLEDAIRAYAVADVPVGAFLSGGLDSAAVVGLMVRAGGSSPKTFSLGFEDGPYSEAAEAAATARYYGVEHHTSILTGTEVADEIETFLAACDQPTGDGINTYYVSRAARAGGVTVALSGLGGDELFGGYPSFRNLPRLAVALRWWRRLPPRWRDRVTRRLERGDTRRRKLADCLRFARDTYEAGALERRVFSEPGRRSLLGPEPLASLGGEAPFHPELAEIREELPDASPRELASAWELRTYMADLLLRDSDVMSMRHSLELRVPLVDRPLIEWLWRQPEAYRFTPCRPKDALAAALADMLPPGMRDRRKQGFSLPMGIWMRRDLKPFLDETFSDASVNRSGFLVRRAVQSTWRRFLGNDDPREWSRVWSLAVLIAFVNRRSGIPGTLAGRPHGLEAHATVPPRPLPSGHTLLMAPEIFGDSGGIQRILQLYLRALSDLDAENNRSVRLLALNDAEFDSTIARHYAGKGLDDWYVCDRKKIRFVRAALRMARKSDRIVCGHIAQLPVAWLAHRLNPGLRYYLLAHGIEVWRPFSLAERIALRGAARVFCISEFTRRELLRRCPLPEDRLVVVPNALDPSFAIQPGLPPAECPPVILTAARLTSADRYKGVDDLIAAMPAILAAEPAARLRVVGRGDDQQRLEALARNLGLAGGPVYFFGYVTDRQLQAEMAACRLFALPSGREGFGLVFLEAMAHGRPCLGARAGGVPEIITDQTGVLVEFGNVASVAAGCIGALRRDWPQEPILERARQFSYGPFKARLAAQFDRDQPHP